MGACKMSILIKGMEMPAKGEYRLVLYCHSDGTATLEGVSTEFEGEPFEVVEVPTPHGRLIDADKFERDIEQYHLSDGKFQHWVQVQNTIIEAEEE